MAAHSSGNASVRSGHILPLMALNVCTGTAMALMAQYVNDLDIADGRVQALAWVKYVAMLSFTSLQRWHSRRSYAASAAVHKRSDDKKQSPAERPPSAKARRLMVVIGLLDLVSYILHCVGFVLCGAATASVVFAAACQTFTALLSRFVLRRTLRAGQVAAVALVLLGILLRGTCGAGGGKSAAAAETPPGQNLGYIAILGSAFGYACLGVVYDYMMRLEQPPPSHAQVMDLASRIGLAANTAYQITYTLPRWQSLVGDRLQRRGTSPAAAVGALVAFGVAIVSHTVVQGAVHRSEGALAVGLVSAVSSGLVSICASLLFCGPAQPWMCMTPCKAAAAAVVTAGGIAWVLAGKGPAAGAAPAGKESKKLD